MPSKSAKPAKRAKSAKPAKRAKSATSAKPATPATPATATLKVRVNEDHLTSWPTKQEAAAQMGISFRSVERLIGQRRIGAAWRHTLLGRPERVCNPDDIGELMAARDAAAMQEAVSAPVAELFTEAEEVSPGPGLFTSLIRPERKPGGGGEMALAVLSVAGEGISAASEALGNATEQMEALVALLQKPRVPVENKLLLKKRECVALGLSLRWLKDRLAAGDLKNYGQGRVARVSRVELDRLLGDKPRA